MTYWFEEGWLDLLSDEGVTFLTKSDAEVKIEEGLKSFNILNLKIENSRLSEDWKPPQALSSIIT